MNAATRGVILAAAAVLVGVLVLGQAYSDDTPSFETASPAPESGDSGGDDGSSDDSSSDDSTSDDGSSDSGATDDTGTDSSTDGGDSSDAGGDSTDGSTDGGTDPPNILHPPAEVRVLVANGTSVAGAAGRVSDILEARNYGVLTPTNTTEPLDATVVYYVPGYELDARQIAQIIEAPPESVAPMPDTPPVDDLNEAHVLVGLGPDLVTG
ncbi:MAG: LytR C-terminal domain-containing protein [Acidimicrobiales bacterium]